MDSKTAEGEIPHQDGHIASPRPVHSRSRSLAPLTLGQATHLALIRVQLCLL